MTGLAALCIYQVFAQTPAPPAVSINWSAPAKVSNTTPTLQVVVNPMLKRGSPIHDGSFAALKELGADYVRFVPWFPYPHAAVAELKAPGKDSTYWDFSHIDPIVEDFMSATSGHSVVLNFSTIPVWMFKTDRPVEYPADPDKVFWEYNQGAELRDSTMNELTGYFARLFSWYTKGGFTDELGVFHASNHHYSIPYWEVLNEPDLEHSITPQLYTRMYDAIVTALRKISPETKFIGLGLAFEGNPEWFEYFLNPANHTGGIRPEGISYHFYGTKSAKEQTLDQYQYSFFDQANGFLDRVRYIEAIRRRLAPETFTTINELGNILEGSNYTKPIPLLYWNLSGAMYSYLFVELARLGIDVVGESQLVGYPTQFPDVSMMNWTTGQPNARFWCLKLLKEHFGKGDRMVHTASGSPAVVAQAFSTAKGKKLLLINKRNQKQQLQLPDEADRAEVSLVDGGRGLVSDRLKGKTIVLNPFEVAVVQLKD